MRFLLLCRLGCFLRSRLRSRLGCQLCCRLPCRLGRLLCPVGELLRCTDSAGEQIVEELSGAEGGE